MIKLRLPSLGVATRLLIREILIEERTMVSATRLSHLAEICVSSPLPPGSLVECGVARGGCLTLMAYLCPGRQAWGFDSFEGMPPLSEGDQGEGETWVGYRCSGPRGLAEVETTLNRFSVRSARVTLVRGWFEDTLAQYVAAMAPIAILRLDNDWYKSTKYCIETLYDAVAADGVVLVDDYHTFAGCRKAIDEFRAARGIEERIVTVEADSEIVWRKKGITSK